MKQRLVIYSKEFNLIKMLTKLRRMDGQSENFNKETENIRKYKKVRDEE